LEAEASSSQTSFSPLSGIIIPFFLTSYTTWKQMSTQVNKRNVCSCAQLKIVSSWCGCVEVWPGFNPNPSPFSQSVVYFVYN
jgi:hypothetical protein